MWDGEIIVYVCGILLARDDGGIAFFLAYTT